MVALALPVLLPSTMPAVFALARSHFRDRTAYRIGFGTYWTIYLICSVGPIGRGGIRQLFQHARPRPRHLSATDVALLVWPRAEVIGTRLLPDVRAASPVELATAASVAVADVILEEILWRGVHITRWPANALLRWVWPALGFGAWRLAPQLIHPSPLRPVRFTIASVARGLSWGWVAFRTGSLRWVSGSHVLTDESGVRNARFFLDS